MPRSRVVTRKTGLLGLHLFSHKYKVPGWHTSRVVVRSYLFQYSSRSSRPGPPRDLSVPSGGLFARYFLPRVLGPRPLSVTKRMRYPVFFPFFYVVHKTFVVRLAGLDRPVPLLSEWSVPARSPSYWTFPHVPVDLFPLQTPGLQSRPKKKKTKQDSKTMFICLYLKDTSITANS